MMTPARQQVGWQPQWTVPCVLAGLCLLGLGVLGGMLAERLRFDVKRAAILTELDATSRQLRGRLMLIERSTSDRSSLASPHTEPQ